MQGLGRGRTALGRSRRLPTSATRRNSTSYHYAFLLVLPWLALGLASAGIVVILRFPYYNEPSVPVQTTLKPAASSLLLPHKTRTPVQVPLPVLDIVSVGSELRPQYHTLQRQAFSRHPAVRDFYALTELDDSEITCHTDLTKNRIKDSLIFCRRRPTNHTYLDSIRQYFGITGNGNLVHMEVEYARGWLCAQKRPMEGFTRALQAYRTGTALPDYLLFIDDDTYLNVDQVARYLRMSHPPDIPGVLTGCLIWMDVGPRAWGWSWGGYGVFFTRGSLERLLQPIDCESAETATDVFIQAVCRRLEQNQIGELSAFSNGMSLADLMHNYTYRHVYIDVKEWTDVGFCLHSDHIWTYFSNYYFLSPTNPNVTFDHAEEDRIYPYQDSRIYPMMWHKNPDREWGQCLHRDEDTACTTDSHICHRISQARMGELWGLEPETLVVTESLP